MNSVLVALAAGASAGLASSLLARLRAPSLPVAAPAPAAPPPEPSPEPAAETAGHLPEETIQAALARLNRLLSPLAEDVNDPADLVNLPEFKDVVAVFRRQDATRELLAQYALSGNWTFASAALIVLADHPDEHDLADPLLRQLENVRPFVVLFALRFLAALRKRPPVGAPLLQATQWWQSNSVIPGFFEEHFRRRAELGDRPDFGGLLQARPGLETAHIEGLLRRIQHPFASHLLASLRSWNATRINRAFLLTVGTLWDPDDADPLLIEPAAWSECLETAEAAIRLEKPRSVLVTGDPRVGKSTLIKLLGARLQDQGWTLFSASGAELMADQMYVGQLEGRIRKLVDALHARRRIVWYVGDFALMAESGRHQSQTASILDQIQPALATGELIVVGEATRAAATKLLQARPSLRSAIEVLVLQAMDEAETLSLAGELAVSVSRHADIDVSEQAVATTMELAQHYLGTGQLPGSVLELLKRAVSRSIGLKESTLTAASVIATLSQISGLPQLILDTSQRADLAQIRHFFASRVIGQDEAVRAVVDRIAMLKAGLTDPGRPIGVFLFAGPTGTGKTELAKTLAEFLFGSPERMTRLDMSEFQTPESTAKILGQRGDGATDSLIDRIRKQPFSVVLLDEFEKAHANTWDLFLQIFDDGRLSDALGREADFRHCFIILTSNLGAAARPGATLGFGRGADADIEEQVMHTVAQTFRPEFVNRLDKIIVFRPLSREKMRGVLHKELARVLERRGLRDRSWAVEWESSAIELLLDKGFSREMGARPLKRAIDQLLLAPLAATLVEHRFPEGDQFLFVRGNGNAIEVEFVDPDGAPEESEAHAEPGDTLSLPAIVLRQTGSPAERAVLAATWRDIQEILEGRAWAAAQETRALAMADPGFWSSETRFATLSAMELADRVKEAARTADRLFQRYMAGSAHNAPASRELAGRVALQLYSIRQGLADIDAKTPVDVLLRVEPAMEAGTDTAGAIVWCLRLLGMYKSWASRRRMQVADFGGASASDLPILHVTGFGAFRTLHPEAGLHVFDEQAGDASRRLVARVVVAAGPDMAPMQTGWRTDAAALLAAAPHVHSIVRRYRADPAPMVRDAVQGWRTGRLDTVLAGDFDLMGAA